MSFVKCFLLLGLGLIFLWNNEIHGSTIKEVYYKKKVPVSTLWTSKKISSWQVRKITFMDCIYICMGYGDCNATVYRTLSDQTTICLPLKYTSNPANAFSPLSTDTVYTVTSRIT